MTNRQAASLPDAFERALDVILARVSAFATSISSVRSLGIAYSGGLDSSALLHLAHRYVKNRGLALHAFHIHHGISANADAWLAHCELECARLGVRFDARRIALSDVESQGVEQAARISRYAALGELCRHYDVPLLLTAHHLDDQAETVLLQLLRGCGLAGLSGMGMVGAAPDLLGAPHPVLGRPLLDIGRAQLEYYVATQQLAYVEDESNSQPHYARNALRHNVMPSLSEYFPGFQDRIARAAQHAQAGQRLLNELGEQDWAACRDGDCLDLRRLEGLSGDRVDNLLRYWFALHDIRMPSSSWLSGLRSQLFKARDDAQLCVTLPECEIRRHRNKLFLTSRTQDNAVGAAPVAFRWWGEAQIEFPEYGGSVCFEPAIEGVSVSWLREQDLLLRCRGGGEKLKSARNRPTRSLKHHYQELDIPAWERLRLPVVCTAAGQLLYAAGVGMNWRDLPSGQECVQLRWVPFARR